VGKRVAKWDPVGQNGATHKQAGVAGLLPLRDSGRLSPRPSGVAGEKISLAFKGHYEYSLDAKNRLTIPAKLRASFSNGLVLARWLDPAVAIFTPEGFHQFQDSVLKDMHPLSDDRRDVDQFFSLSYDLELDSAGRVILPAPLMEWGAIEREVTIVGKSDHLECWDRARLQERESGLPERMARITRSLGNPS